MSYAYYARLAKLNIIWKGKRIFSMQYFIKERVYTAKHLQKLRQQEHRTNNTTRQMRANHKNEHGVHKANMTTCFGQPISHDPKKNWPTHGTKKSDQTSNLAYPKAGLDPQFPNIIKEQRIATTKFTKNREQLYLCISKHNFGRTNGPPMQWYSTTWSSALQVRNMCSGAV